MAAEPEKCAAPFFDRNSGLRICAFRISDENSADQKSGYHEKYIDADIAARYLPAKCVVGNDRGHHDGTQALYIRAEQSAHQTDLTMD